MPLASWTLLFRVWLTSGSRAASFPCFGRVVIEVTGKDHSSSNCFLGPDISSFCKKYVNIRLNIVWDKRGSCDKSQGRE